MSYQAVAADQQCWPNANPNQGNIVSYTNPVIFPQYDFIVVGQDLIRVLRSTGAAWRLVPYGTRWEPINEVSNVPT